MYQGNRRTALKMPWLAPAVVKPSSRRTMSPERTRGVGRLGPVPCLRQLTQWAWEWTPVGGNL